MTYQYELQIPDKSITILVVDFDITNGVYGRSSKAKVVVKSVDATDIEIGDKIYLYIFNSLIFVGYIRYIYDKSGIKEIRAVGEIDEVFRRYARRIIKPSDVGETENMDISLVVKYLVDNYTSFTYTYGSTIQATGIKIRKFILNDYISNALNNLAKAVGYVWYVENGEFYFREPQYAGSDKVLNNSNAVFDDWKVRTDRLVNDLHLICADREYIKSDMFRGDGVTTTYNLSYVPSGSVRVFVGSRELSFDEYEIDYDTPSITFSEPPPAYSSSGDDITNAFPEWAWRRQLTINVDSSATPTSLTDPLVAFGIGETEFDWENTNNDLSDIRFSDSNGNELPYVYIGKDTDGYYWFVVKLSGMTVNAGDSITIYMLYGNVDAVVPTWTKDDILTVFDKWNYDGVANEDIWTKNIDVQGGTLNPDCDNISYESVPTTYLTDWGDVVDTAEYLKLWVDIDETQTDYDVITTTYTISNTTAMNSYTRWVYYDNTNRVYIVKGSTLSLSVSTSYSSECGLTEDYKEEFFYQGVWRFDAFDPMPSVTMGSRELNSNYNIEVRYSFKAPIYVRIQDYESQDVNNGVYSKVKRAYWISDESTAYYIGGNYVEQYKDPLRENKIKVVPKQYVDMGLKAGMIVTINDSLHNESGNFVIYEEKFKKNIVEITVGTEVFDIFEWGAVVEERIRQLEIAGGENFFTR